MSYIALPLSHLNSTGPELFAAPVWSLAVGTAKVKYLFSTQKRVGCNSIQYIVVHSVKWETGPLLFHVRVFVTCWVLMSWHLSLLRNQVCDLLVYT